MLDHSRASLPTLFSPVDTHHLMKRICVRAPYFALQNLRLFDGTFMAEATAESRATAEQGPMQAGEISRHAAICGLCAVALAFDDDDRRYYLAQDASYTGFANAAPYGSEVSFSATVLDRNKRQAVAEIVITAGGRDLAHLRVTYTILSDASFRRLFRSKYDPTFSVLNYDRMPDPPTGDFTTEGNTTVLTLPEIPRDACAGHFENFPAMPVAVLMGQLGVVASRHYRAPYRVAAATMSALDFCWAGESARFEVTPTAPGTYACAASASDAVVSEMTLHLTPA
ncbi:acyl-coenzyme A thioesterase PaaI-like protein [Deinococcus metalli]|uniref:Acyl-coenzyme A thioesterase PaaI-like protein n=1 Tax=Deinococcus metalli TaxID=1141878 RepID=A0A7W8NNE8_9DEIO|nr:hypothetical protein [Deinococcus metalli]MBB5375681.1 acyl-coenzyme A thioesterase PaaI-like protein [Deinococcus metalli]GHF37823.1 hypothetical protein GCM10017781_13200 [Deinococcus metalli]